MKRFKPRRILVPVDFSSFSLLSLQTAREMAEMWGAELTVLHVMALPPALSASGEPSVVYANWERMQEEIREESERELEAIMNEAGVNHHAQKISVWGHPAAEVVDMAQTGDFDLIVMSTHGRTGLARMVMGSVAENVIRHAPCPVFVLRHPERN